MQGANVSFSVIPAENLVFKVNGVLIAFEKIHTEQTVKRNIRPTVFYDPGHKIFFGYAGQPLPNLALQLQHQ
jgi:hypothetical protein